MKEINVINKVSKSPDNTTVEINNIKQTLTSNEESIDELKTKVEQSLSLGVSAKNSMVQAINSKKTVSDVSSTDNWGTLSQRVTDIKEGSGNAKVEDVLSGKTFTNSDGVEYTGSIPILSSSTSASEVSIYSNRDVAVRPPKGFCDGTVQIKTTSAQLQQAETNLRPNNIKQGVNVLGVVGSLAPLPSLNTSATWSTTVLNAEYGFNSWGSNISIPLFSLNNRAINGLILATNSSSDYLLFNYSSSTSNMTLRIVFNTGEIISWFVGSNSWSYGSSDLGSELYAYQIGDYIITSNASKYSSSSVFYTRCSITKLKNPNSCLGECRVELFTEKNETSNLGSHIRDGSSSTSLAYKTCTM